MNVAIRSRASLIRTGAGSANYGMGFMTTADCIADPFLSSRCREVYRYRSQDNASFLRAPVTSMPAVYSSLHFLGQRQMAPSEVHRPCLKILLPNEESLVVN